MAHRVRKAILATGLLLSSLCVTAAMNAKEFFKTSQEQSFAVAAADGRTEDLERLVAHGANVNARGLDGMTPLYWAMEHESKDGVSWLLNHGADPNAVFARDGTSATSLAAMSGNSLL